MSPIESPCNGICAADTNASPHGAPEPPSQLCINPPSQPQSQIHTYGSSRGGRGTERVALQYRLADTSDGQLRSSRGAQRTAGPPRGGWRPERSETANLRRGHCPHFRLRIQSMSPIGARTSHVPGGVQCSSIPGFAVFDMTARACSTTTPARLYFSGVSSDSGIEGDERPGASGRRRGRRSPSSEISGVGRPVLFDSFRCRSGVRLGPRGSCRSD